MAYQGNTYTDQVREGLWEVWQREAYGQSWGALRERLRYSSHASWDPYFEAFNEEHRELLDIPPDVTWEEHCEAALDGFVQWLDEHVDWRLFDSRTADGDPAGYTQGQDQWSHGVEQDMSAGASWAGQSDEWTTGYGETYPGYESAAPAAYEAPAEHFADGSGPAGDASPHGVSGAVDPELAREALQVFASSTDDPSVLTEEHLAALQVIPIEVEEDVSGPPDFAD
ncbi:hypothetical protein [Streptomyces sp. NPDC093223]|uniref:hypothetical protein n=1 Tax=Streptomyces sp. NPDC093223 TaxID=3366033 RepID=UPI0037FFEE60